MKLFFFNVIGTTVIQIVGLLGTFFFIGFLLSKIQERTQQAYRAVVGWKGILWTAWFGTPLHEFGHIIFAKIFRHRVEEISLFRPNKTTGTLGHVSHSYNPKSLYQQIGNFFIGGAPMIFGVLLLSFLGYILLPDGKTLFSPLVAIDEPMTVAALFLFIRHILAIFFDPASLTRWHFWLFLYVSFCVATHIAPSKEDRSNMWKGLGWIIVLLFFINMITLLFGQDITTRVLALRAYTGIMIGMFVYTLFIALFHFLLVWCVFAPIRLIQRKRHKRIVL